MQNPRIQAVGLVQDSSWSQVTGKSIGPVWFGVKLVHGTDKCHGDLSYPGSGMAPPRFWKAPKEGLDQWSADLTPQEMEQTDDRF